MRFQMFCGMDTVMCSVRSSLLFLSVLCSVLCNVSSVLFIYVSVGFSVHSVQCQSIASVQFYSVQCKQCSESYSISSVS